MSKSDSTSSEFASKPNKPYPGDGQRRSAGRRTTSAPGTISTAPSRNITLRRSIDGLQPDVGHEMLWVLRDALVVTYLRGICLAGYATHSDIDHT